MKPRERTIVYKMDRGFANALVREWGASYDTVTETWTELHNAQVALDRGDVDGAKVIVALLAKRYDKIVDGESL